MMETGDKWYFFDKNRPNKGIEARRPKTIFKKSHFYSLSEKGNSRTRLIEAQLGKLEDRTAPLLRCLIKNALNGRPSILNHEKHETLCKYFFVLHRRTIDVFNSAEVIVNFEDKVKEYILDFEKTFGPVDPTVKTYFQSKQTIDEMRQNVWANSVLSIEGQALSTLKKMGLAVGVAPFNKSFIIGTSSIVRFDDYPLQSLGDDGVEMWLPIGKRVAISPHKKYGSCKTLQMTTNMVRMINESIFKKSSSVASSSEVLLKSLVTSKTSVLTISNTYPDVQK